MSFRVHAALTCAVCCTVSLAAAETVRPGRYALDEAIRRAEEVSPLVKRAHAERMVIAARRVGASQLLPYNPAVTAVVGHRNDVSSTMPPSTGLEWSLRLEQTLEVAGQRGTRIKEASSAIEVAVLREQFARVETRARVKTIYLAALIGEAHAASARKREELGQRLYESARARVQAGAASDVELHLAEVESGRLKHERIEAELHVQAALSELRLWLGLPLAAPLELSTGLAAPKLPEQTVDSLAQQAIERRADLRAIEKYGTQLDATIVRLRREVVPSPTVFIDVTQQQPGQTYAGGGLSLPLPVFARNQGPLAEARAERERAAQELTLAEHEVQVDVSNLFRAAFARAQEEQLWDKQILPAAESNVELVSQGWRAGKFDLFRVIQVSREAAEAKRKQLETLGELWKASIALSRATGSP